MLFLLPAIQASATCSNYAPMKDNKKLQSLDTLRFQLRSGKQHLVKCKIRRKSCWIYRRKIRTKREMRTKPSRCRLYQLGETRDRELNGGQMYWSKIKIQDKMRKGKYAISASASSEFSCSLHAFIMFHLLVLESTPTIFTRIHKYTKFQMTELLILHVCQTHIISCISSELFDFS